MHISDSLVFYIAAFRNIVESFRLNNPSKPKEATGRFVWRRLIGSRKRPVSSIPDIAVLQRIKVLAGLPEDHLIALANQLQLAEAQENQVLLSLGSNEQASIFVVQGKIQLLAEDGRSKTLRVDEDQEMRPIAQLRPSIYDVTALGPVTYLKIDRDQLIEFAKLSEAASSDISVHSLFSDDDEDDNSIVNHLYHNLMDNSIKLPSLPSVADRVQGVYRGEDTDVDTLAHILVSYPDVARKIKNVARCANNDRLSSIEKLRYSIKRLGTPAVYSMIMTYAVGKLVRRLPVAHLQRVKSFWDHSLGVAAIARILAKQTRSASPDLAMLAGLVHGIGVLVIDDRLLEHHHLKLDHLEIDHAIQVMRPEISSLLLRKWDYDNELIQVAEECGDWSRDHEGPADLCDLILVANYYALLHSDTNRTLPGAHAVPAIEKLRVSPDQAIDAIKQMPNVKRNIKKLFI